LQPQNATPPLPPFWKIRGEMPPLSWVLKSSRVHGVTLHKKVRNCEIRKALNVNHSYSESREPTCVGSVMCPECPGKLTRHVLLAEPTFLRPVLENVEPAELSQITVDCEVSWVQLRLLAPQTTPEEKQAREWIFEVQYVTMQISSHLPNIKPASRFPFDGYKSHRSSSKCL